MRTIRPCFLLLCEVRLLCVGITYQAFSVNNGILLKLILGAYHNLTMSRQPPIASKPLQGVQPSGVAPVDSAQVVDECVHIMSVNSIETLTIPNVRYLKLFCQLVQLKYYIAMLHQCFGLPPPSNQNIMPVMPGVEGIIHMASSHVPQPGTSAPPDLGLDIDWSDIQVGPMDSTEVNIDISFTNGKMSPSPPAIAATPASIGLASTSPPTPTLTQQCVEVPARETESTVFLSATVDQPLSLFNYLGPIILQEGEPPFISLHATVHALRTTGQFTIWASDVLRFIASDVAHRDIVDAALLSSIKSHQHVKPHPVWLPPFNVKGDTICLRSTPLRRESNFSYIGALVFLAHFAPKTLNVFFRQPNFRSQFLKFLHDFVKQANCLHGVYITLDYCPQPSRHTSASGVLAYIDHVCLRGPWSLISGGRREAALNVLHFVRSLK